MKARRIKQIYIDYFRNNASFSSCHVEMRPYNIKVDPLSTKFSQEDWNLMFSGRERSILQKWTELDDRIVLSCFEKQTKLPFGFIMLFQPHPDNDDLWFHGGTWLHSRKPTLLAYESLYKILSFLIDNGFNVRASCYKINKRADALQRHFGFVEFVTDEESSYKQLDKDLFANNGIRGILERCFAQIDNHELLSCLQNKQY